MAVERIDRADDPRVAAYRVVREGEDLGPAIAGIAADVPIVVSGAEELAEIAGYDVHRGCLALVHRRPETAAHCAARD